LATLLVGLASVFLLATADLGWHGEMRIDSESRQLRLRWTGRVTFL